MEGSLKKCLLNGKELSQEEVSVLKDRLCSKMLQELRVLAKDMNVRLTGSSRKTDIVKCLIEMARIGATRDDSLDDETDFSGISYITLEVREVLRRLPAFSSVKEWSKKLKGVLKDFTFMNLLIYLVYGRDKSFDMQSLKAFKSLKAYKFFYDGFVKNVWVHEFPISEAGLRMLYFRAYVHHSLTCDAPLETYVALNGDSGDVYSAQCTCVSGLGQACNHIAALLFYIEHHASHGELPYDLSKTSKAMTWNQPPKKEIKPARAEDIQFVKPSHSDINEVKAVQSIQRNQFDPRHPAHRVLDPDKLKQLLTHVQTSIPGTGLQQFWKTRSAEKVTSGNQLSILWNHVLFWHENVSSVSCKKFFTPTEEQCSEYFSNLKLSYDEMEAIEAATQGQTDNDLWFALHNGRITSSRFGEIIHRRQSTDSRRLVKDIMGYGGRMQHAPPQIRWGRENEDAARTCYIANRKACGEYMVVESTGLRLLPEKAYLGASSDGRVIYTNIDTCCVGCLEVKCPYSIEGNVTVQLTPEEIEKKYGNKFFMRRGDDMMLHLPKAHPYYAQVQGEMAILNVEWCDFVVFSNGSVIVDRILADYDYWKKICDTLDEFYMKHVIPEILSGTIFKEEYAALFELIH